MLKPQEVLELGIADKMFGSARFLEESLAWADEVIGGKKVKRKHEPGAVEKATMWGPAISIARSTVEEKLGKVPLSPYLALDLIAAAKSGSKEAAFRRETTQLRSSLPRISSAHLSMHSTLFKSMRKSQAELPTRH